MIMLTMKMMVMMVDDGYNDDYGYNDYNSL